MRILKIILFSIFGIIALLLIIAAFLPKHYAISVTETINQPKDKVYDYMRLFSKQEEYSEWLRPDPSLHPTISGVDGTVGAVQTWNSKDDNVGEGSQTITAISPDKIDYDLKFIRPMASTAKVSNSFTAIDSTHTLVTTSFYGDSYWPLNLLSNWVGKGIISKTSQNNLKNVKAILEK